MSNGNVRNLAFRTYRHRSATLGSFRNRMYFFRTCMLLVDFNAWTRLTLSKIIDMHSDKYHVPLIMREEGRCIESLIAFHDGISFFFYYDRLEFSWHNHLSRIKRVLSRPRHGYTCHRLECTLLDTRLTINRRSKAVYLVSNILLADFCLVQAFARPKYNLFNKQNEGGKPYLDLTSR